MELRTGGMEAPATLKKTIWLELSAGRQKRAFELTVAADLRGDVVVEPIELVFNPAGPEGAHLGAIDIRREMLTAAEFGTLELVRLAPYYHVKARTHGSDRLRVLLELGRAAAPTYPRPIELEYRRAGVLKVVYLPVRRPGRTDGVSVVPSSYLASVAASLEPAELRQRTKRDMRLVASGQRGVTITGIESTSPDHPFGWAVRPDREGRFEMWVKHLPQERRISSAAAVVSYFDARQGRRGKVNLSAYVLSKR